jgi:Fe-S-cluster containining protein
MKLEILYEELPKMECKGLCHESCGPIELTNEERKLIINYLRDTGIKTKEFKHFSTPIVIEHIKERHVNDSDGCLTCPYLKKNKCEIYPVRPMICRLWGMVDSNMMRCPHGCIPSKWLTRKEAFSLLNLGRKS